MTELSGAVRELIKAGMGTDLPAAGTRERVWEAVQRQIAAPGPNSGDTGTPQGADPSGAGSIGAAQTAATVSGTGSAALATKLMIGAAVVIATATVATTVLLTTPDPQPPRRPATLEEPSAAAEEVDDHGPPVRFRLRPVPVAETPTVSVDALAEEAKLLQEAQRALKAGDPQTALEFLDLHAARYRSGALGPERRLARVLALCEVGDIAGATAVGHALLAEQPNGLLAERVKSSCADLSNSIPSD